MTLKNVSISVFIIAMMLMMLDLWVYAALLAATFGALTIRNHYVHNFRHEVQVLVRTINLAELALQHAFPQTVLRRRRDRAKILDSVSHEKMVLMFWRPLTIDEWYDTE